MYFLLHFLTIFMISRDHQDAPLKTCRIYFFSFNWHANSLFILLILPALSPVRGTSPASIKKTNQPFRQTHTEYSAVSPHQIPVSLPLGFCSFFLFFQVLCRREVMHMRGPQPTKRLADLHATANLCINSIATASKTS